MICAVTDKRLQMTKISSVLVVKLYSSARLLVFTLFTKCYTVSESLHDETLLMFDHQQHLLPSCIITTDTGNSDKLVELEGFLFIVLDLLKSSVVVVCMFFVYILCWLQASIPYFIGFVGPDSP